MSYVRCVRGLASGIEYSADAPMNLDPADGRPVEMVLDLERLAAEQLAERSHLGRATVSGLLRASN